jgi:putative oxidoreductase
MTSISPIHDPAPTCSSLRCLVNAGACSLPSRAAEASRRAGPLAQALVLFALRLLYGGLLAQTGWGKLANLERTTAFFEGLGLPLPALTALLVGGVELLGGVVLVAGFATRLSAAALVTVMGTALATAHAPEAFQSLESFTAQPPYPFLVATVLLAAFGPGPASVDAWRRRRKARTGEG